VPVIWAAYLFGAEYTWLTEPGQICFAVFMLFAFSELHLICLSRPTVFFNLSTVLYFPEHPTE